jgi:hypothetical protein
MPPTIAGELKVEIIPWKLHEGFERMTHRSDRRGEHADNSPGQLMAVTTIGDPMRAYFIMARSHNRAPSKRPEIRLQSRPHHHLESLFYVRHPKGKNDEVVPTQFNTSI